MARALLGVELIAIAGVDFAMAEDLEPLADLSSAWPNRTGRHERSRDRRAAR